MRPLPIVPRQTASVQLPFPNLPAGSSTSITLQITQAVETAADAYPHTPHIRKTTPPIVKGYIPPSERPLPPVTSIPGGPTSGMDPVPRTYSWLQPPMSGFEAVFGVSVHPAQPISGVAPGAQSLLAPQFTNPPWPRPASFVSPPAYILDTSYATGTVGHEGDLWSTASECLPTYYELGDHASYHLSSVHAPPDLLPLAALPTAFTPYQCGPYPLDLRPRAFPAPAPFESMPQQHTTAFGPTLERVNVSQQSFHLIGTEQAQIPPAQPTRPSSGGSTSSEAQQTAGQRRSRRSRAPSQLKKTSVHRGKARAHPAPLTIPVPTIGVPASSTTQKPTVATFPPHEPPPPLSASDAPVPPTSATLPFAPLTPQLVTPHGAWFPFGPTPSTFSGSTGVVGVTDKTPSSGSDDSITAPLSSIQDPPKCDAAYTTTSGDATMYDAMLWEGVDAAQYDFVPNLNVFPDTASLYAPQPGLRAVSATLPLAASQVQASTTGSALRPSYLASPTVPGIPSGIKREEGALHFDHAFVTGTSVSMPSGSSSSDDTTLNVQLIGSHSASMRSHTDVGVDLVSIAIPSLPQKPKWWTPVSDSTSAVSQQAHSVFYSVGTRTDEPGNPLCL